MKLSSMTFSPPKVSASSARETLSTESGSRTRRFRCSTTALASGLVKVRSGSTNS